MMRARRGAGKRTAVRDGDVDEAAGGLPGRLSHQDKARAHARTFFFVILLPLLLFLLLVVFVLFLLFLPLILRCFFFPSHSCYALLFALTRSHCALQCDGADEAVPDARRPRAVAAGAWLPRHLQVRTPFAPASSSPCLIHSSSM